MLLLFIKMEMGGYLGDRSRVIPVLRSGERFLGARSWPPCCIAYPGARKDMSSEKGNDSP